MKPTPTALGVTREIEGDRRADPRLRWRTCTQSGTLERVQAAFEGQAGSKAASSARIRSARRSHFPGVAVVQLIAAGTDWAGAGVFSEVLMPAPKQGGAARISVLVGATGASDLFGLERDVAVDFGLRRSMLALNLSASMADAVLCPLVAISIGSLATSELFEQDD